MRTPKVVFVAPSLMNGREDGQVEYRAVAGDKVVSQWGAVITFATPEMRDAWLRRNSQSK